MPKTKGNKVGSAVRSIVIQAEGLHQSGLPRSSPTSNTELDVLASSVGARDRSSDCL
jgi:hypothetical protein